MFIGRRRAPGKESLEVIRGEGSSQLLLVELRYESGGCSCPGFCWLEESEFSRELQFKSNIFSK